MPVDIQNQTAVLGVPFTTTVPPVSGDGGPFNEFLTRMPKWASFNPTTRLLTGVPDTTGTRGLLFVYFDSLGRNGGAVALITVNRPGGPPPTAPAVPNLAATTGVLFSVILNEGSGGTAPLAYAVSSRPGWLNFEPASRVLTGTPPSPGTHRLILFVSDSAGYEAISDFLFTVS